MRGILLAAVLSCGLWVAIVWGMLHVIYTVFP